MVNCPTQLFINNQWSDAHSGETFETINPSTETVVTSVARAGETDVDRAVRAAHEAMSGPWAKVTPAERGTMLFKLADLVEANQDALAEIETLDVGKPLGDARGDMGGVASTFRYNAGAADKMEGATIPLGPDYVDYTVMEPLGVTAHITPWNFPMGMAARSLAPALAAGCTVVLKPAEQSPLSALAFAELVVEAGFPEGVVNVINGFGDEAGAALVAHPLVRGVTFTGSVATGREVYKNAASGIKSVVLELGGKNPMIVFPDADLDRAAADAAVGIFFNSGQVCSASSLLVLHEDIKEAFIERFEKHASKLTMGNAIDDLDLGPLVSKEQYDRVNAYLSAAKDGAAKIRFGGGCPADLDTGYFIEPTLIECADMEHVVCREEIFGPVAVAVPFTDEDQAVQIANSLEYGLVSGVYTQNISRALKMASQIDAGTVWINGWFVGGVQAPTGGNKNSGVGRERGLPGIANYLNVKNIGICL